MWLRSNWGNSYWTASYWYGPAQESIDGAPPSNFRPDRLAAIQRDDEEVIMAVTALLARLRS